jgi:hypothetical protein
LSRGTIVIDRSRERAAFYNLSVWQPFRRVIRPISTIVGAQVTKHQRGASRPAYGIVIHLFQGDPIRFACRSRAIAMAVLEALYAHFPVEMRSCGRYERHGATHNTESDARPLWSAKTARS